MSDTLAGAAIRRATLFACTALAVAGVASPAFADPIDVIASVRVPNIAQPTSPESAALLRGRIANAAEEVCGSTSTSLPDVRYATRRSQCFRDSYATAMAQVRARWGEAATGGAGTQ